MTRASFGVTKERVGALLALGAIACTPPVRVASSTDAGTGDDWPSYGGGVLGTRHSPLAQIDTQSVRRPAPAGTYPPGELGPEAQTRNNRSLEVTPIVVDGTMYIITPLARIIALDPSTGTERWRYDAHLDRS